MVVLIVHVDRIIFWEEKAARWSGTERRRKGPEMGGAGWSRRRCWPRERNDRDKDEGETERGSDGERRRERHRLVLVIGVDGRKKYNIYMS
jgi:hypothetical protein